MHLIKLDATDSTNAYLRRLVLSTTPEDYTVIAAKQQSQGRGQMGTQWQSEAGKNLTFSLLRRDLNLNVQQGFVLNICVSLAIYTVLKHIQVPHLSIKWPNDILSGRSKICGTLIENKVQGKEIITSIIGIGLNVNQLTFDNLQNVSSLHLLLGKAFELDTLLYGIVDALKTIFLEREKTGDRPLWDAYESALFRKGKPSTFENTVGERFDGKISGVTKNGKLIISCEDAVSKTFDLKEVRLLY